MVSFSSPSVPPSAPQNAKPAQFLQSAASWVCLRGVPFSAEPPSLPLSALASLFCLGHRSSPPLLSSPLPPPVHRHTRAGGSAQAGARSTTTARTAAPLLMYGGLKALNHSSKLFSTLAHLQAEKPQMDNSWTSFKNKTTQKFKSSYQFSGI